MCFHSDRVTGFVMLYSSASASFVSHFSTKLSGSTSSKRGSALSSAFNFRATFASNTRRYPFISKGNFFIAQYPVLRTVQCALDFTSLTDLFTQTPSQLLWEASSHMLQLMRECCSYTHPPLCIGYNIKNVLFNI